MLKLGGTAAVAALASRVPLAAQTKRRILFLGGTGFIGPHIIHAALARGHELAMLNRGQRTPTQNTDDFSRVEAIRGDRTLPDAYTALAGKKWDIVIDTATNLKWTSEAVAALKGTAGRFIYVSSTGVFLPYRTVDIPEDGPVPLTDTPAQDPPSYGVLKAQS
jgi:2'-hydroxyisoflavone reductase